MKQNLLTVSFWVYLGDNGDGSACPYYFSSQRRAEKYAEENSYGQRLCDDVFFDSITIDLDKKKIIDEG